MTQQAKPTSAERAKYISAILLEAGRTGAGSFIARRGERGIAFHEFVRREIKESQRDLLDALRAMIDAYDSDDGHGPIAVIKQARAAIAQAEDR